MSRWLVGGLLALLVGAGVASPSSAGTATATVRVGKSSQTLTGGTCTTLGRGLQVRMIPGERRTFQLSFYTRKAGTHTSRPSERISGGKIAFSRGGKTVYSTTFRLTLGASGRNGTFTGKLARRYGRTSFRGSFSC